MIHWGWMVGAGLSLALLTVACRREPVVHDDGRGADRHPILRVLQGTQSASECEGLVVCRDSASFAELWASHSRNQLPQPPAPEVDFEHLYVICLFAGNRSSAGYAVTIQGVNESTGGGLEVIASEAQPKEGSAQATLMTSPFEMVAVPHFEGTAELTWVE